MLWNENHMWLNWNSQLTVKVIVWSNSQSQIQTGYIYISFLFLAELQRPIWDETPPLFFHSSLFLLYLNVYTQTPGVLHSPGTAPTIQLPPPLTASSAPGHVHVLSLVSPVPHLRPSLQSQPDAPPADVLQRDCPTAQWRAPGCAGWCAWSTHSSAPGQPTSPQPGPPWGASQSAPAARGTLDGDEPLVGHHTGTF